MSVDWPLTAIDDIKAPEKGSIAIGPFGSRMKSDCYVDKGIPVIRGTNITGGPSFEGEFVYIPKEKADSLGSSNVYKNDLVFPHRGAIGEVGIVLKDERYVLSSSLMKLTCDVKKVNPKFIYYFFKSRLGRHELLKNASQVGTPGIGQPLTSLKGIELKLPPKDVQDRIASILFSLDEKIEANRQANQILEQIAQTLFKSWFVDFDPVKAKITALEAGGSAEDAELTAMGVIAAKTPEELAELKQTKPETYQNLAQTAALFPSAMQESELGEIPEGWGTARIDSTLELVYGKSLTKSERVDGEIPVYGSGGIGGFHNKPLVKGPGIIVGRKGTIGSIYWESRDFFPIDTVYYVNPVGYASLEFLYYLLQTLGLESMNTDAAVPGLNRNNVYRLEVPRIPESIVAKFTEMTRALKKLVDENLCQSGRLMDTRDTLLPKLLSGEIDLERLKEEPSEANA